MVLRFFCICTLVRQDVESARNSIKPTFSGVAQDSGEPVPSFIAERAHILFGDVRFHIHWADPHIIPIIAEEVSSWIGKVPRVKHFNELFAGYA